MADREREPETTRSADERPVEDQPIRRDPDVGILAARERFGGVDIPATLVGMLTAIALLVILGGLVGGAITAFGYQVGLENREEVSIAGLVAGLIVLFVAFLIGGWAAGRMARYDGVRNGVMVVVWAVILIAILSAVSAALGERYDVLVRADLPRLDRDVVAIGALVSAVVAVVTMLLGAIIGGIWGVRYHRRADREIVDHAVVAR